MGSLTLDGKVAFITGSTRGIGWATAELFASNGAAIVLNGRSDAELLHARAAALRQRFGTECLELLADVAQEEEVEKCYQQIFRRFRKLDVLVNNAGVLEGTVLGMISSGSIRSSFETNTFAAIYNLQHAARLMGRARSGSIVNLTSILATRGAEGQSVYAASKAALIGLTLSAAKELAARNIRVNAVAPGFIETRMLHHNMTQEKLAQRLGSIGMGRFGSPEDVAGAILFLSSDLASYITGQVLGVDGGAII